LRQEDWELKARLGYMASSRTAWAAQGDLVSTNKQNQPAKKQKYYLLFDFFSATKKCKNHSLHTGHRGRKSSRHTSYRQFYLFFC
jgi:hypothetical protein